MKKRDSGHRPKGSLAIVASATVALLAVGMIGCSDQGLHIPYVLWEPKNKNPSKDALSKEALASAAPYTPPISSGSGPNTIDNVVASVDGNPITSQDVKNVGTKSGLGSPNSVDPSGAPIPDDPNAKLKMLITQQLMEQESQKYKDKVDDGDVDRMIANIEERNHITDQQLRDQLQSQGVSYATFRSKIRKQALAMAMFQKEVRDKAVVSDTEIEEFYKEHSDEFTITEEKYQLAQILIAVPAGATPDQVSAAQLKAKDVHKLAVKGENFADLARQYSDDDSKSKGGELGTFKPDELNDDIAAGIKKVKVGDVSDVIKTKYGFHIVKVEDHEVPGTIPLADVKSQIREKLQADKSKGDLQKWVDQDLVKEHYVETSD